MGVVDPFIHPLHSCISPPSARCSLLQKGHTGRGGSFPSDPGYSLCRPPGNGDRETAHTFPTSTCKWKLNQTLHMEIIAFNKEMTKKGPKMDNTVTRHAKWKVGDKRTTWIHWVKQIILAGQNVAIASSASLICLKAPPCVKFSSIKWCKQFAFIRFPSSVPSLHHLPWKTHKQIQSWQNVATFFQVNWLILQILKWYICLKIPLLKL